MQNTKKNTITAFHFLKMFFSSWIVQLLGVLGGIAVIVVFVLGVYFCYNKCSLNPTPGIVTVTGNDTRTIVTSGMWKKYSTKARRVCKCLINAARNHFEKVNINNFFKLKQLWYFMFKFDLYYIYVRINLYGAQLSIDFIFNSIVLLFYASAV